MIIIFCLQYQRNRERLRDS